MLHLRTSLILRSAITSGRRTFHHSKILSIKAGDAFPDVELMEDSPGNKLSLARLLHKQDKAIVVGVPAGENRSASQPSIQLLNFVDIYSFLSRLLGDSHTWLYLCEVWHSNLCGFGQ